MYDLPWIDHVPTDSFAVATYAGPGTAGEHIHMSCKDVVKVEMNHYSSKLSKMVCHFKFYQPKYV